MGADRRSAGTGEPIDPDVGPAAAATPPGLLRGQGPVVAVVAVGGALGAAARYGATLIWPVATGAFPWTTLAVNVAGCAAIGVLMVLVAEGADLAEGAEVTETAETADTAETNEVTDVPGASGAPGSAGATEAAKAAELTEAAERTDSTASTGSTGSTTSTARRPAHPLLRPFLGTGVLGGFTTFSTYTMDVERLAAAGHLRTALACLALTLLAALAAVWCAAALTRRAVTRRRARASRAGEDR
nr:CrcB family protein [Streptomyces silvensis]